jgi:ketosteroid isomerase-like protein
MQILDQLLMEIQIQIIEQATVIWIKVEGYWKITHEHFSPLKTN